MKRAFNLLLMCLIAASLKPLLAMDESTGINEQHVRRLAEEQNFTNRPGRHTRLSPIPANRQHEFEKIQKHRKIFQEYQKEVYGKQNIYVIPMGFKESADVISRKIFIDYIDKYRESGVNIENVVSWNSINYTCTNVSDAENSDNTWKIIASVAEPSSKTHIKNLMYRPAYIVALHETMHVEETEIGISRAKFNSLSGIVNEVLTVTKTLILLDKVYKEIMSVPSEQEVDYGVTFEIFGKRISQGQLAIFYGDLESKYENLAEALISVESLDFLGYSTYAPIGRIQHRDFPTYLPGLGLNQMLFEYGRFVSSFNADNNDLPQISLRASLDLGNRRIETMLRSQRVEASLSKNNRDEQANNRRVNFNIEPAQTDLRKQFDVACVDGDLELLEETLQKVNEQYDFISQSSGVMKVTGLHMAAEFGHDAIVKTLLKIAEEANKIKDFLSKTDSMDRTALELAREQKRTSIIELLDAYNFNL